MKSERLDMTKKKMAGAVLMAAAAVTVMAASLDAPPAMWVGDSSESDVSSYVSFSSSSPGSITISFAGQAGPPSYVVGTVVADGGAPESPFVGDYIEAGALGLSFRICGDGHQPLNPAVLLVGESGRRWFNPNVLISETPGEWNLNQVSFEMDSGWSCASGGGPAEWEEDLRHVVLIGVRLAQGGTAAQSYTIEEFRLIDADGFITPPADLTPLQEALKNRFGVTSIDEIPDAEKQKDTDSDGMTDLYEILCEYDLKFADSVFVADPVAADETGITLRWACVAGKKYTVFRSEDLLRGFHSLEGAVDMVAPETGYMTYRDATATGQGPYFYRILRR